MKIQLLLLENFTLALKDFSADNDVEDVKSTLEKFKQLQPRISDAKQKDINYWRKAGFNELKTFLANLELMGSKRQRVKGIKAASDEILTIKKEGDVHLFVPLSQNASCFYGSGTKWCISTRDGNNYFYNYVFNRHLYVVFLIKGENVYALVTDGDGTVKEIQDKRNLNDIPEKDFFAWAGISKENLMNFLDHNKDKIIESIAKSRKEKIPSHVVEVIEKYRENPSAAIVTLHFDMQNAGIKYSELAESHPALKELIEKTAKATPSGAVGYAKYFLGGRFPEAEDIIATDAKAAVDYAMSVLRRSRFQKGEKAISKTAKTALEYAKYVIGGKWPAGEPAIARDAESAYFYAVYVIDAIFPAGEPAIKADARVRLAYMDYFGITL